MKVIIPSQTATGNGAFIILNSARVKVGVGTLEISKDVVINEWDGVQYAAAVKDASAVVLNSTQTSGFLDGPGQYQLVKPITVAAAHVYVEGGTEAQIRWL